VEFIFYLSILVSDFKFRKIYNNNVVILLLIFLNNEQWGGYHSLGYSLIIFIIGIILVSFGILGGGDVKLISCLSIALDVSKIMDFIFLIPFLGVIFFPCIIIIEKFLYKYTKVQKNNGMPFSFAIISSFILVNYIII
jgi:prepilin peptidase CpaA